ncbi:hypothetical protein OHA18_25845 [Kribbella sp. NBC_00709]|uniref:hypothetical protein n=1 Tax=Kribbella sp. NBC_00709 TaxID=2975972 RepID=UPI002E2BED3F|nr:hypothetical protein [Kribbella sp. NBC_00709]
MVDYRSFFEVGDVEDFEHEIDRQLHSWLLSKSLRLEALPTGRQIVAEGTFVDVVLDVSPDGSRRRRIRLSEPSGWTTQLTTEVGPHQPSSVWLELDAAEPGSWTATPGLVRRLVDAFDATDGLAMLRGQPVIVREDDVDDLLDVVCDPDRRGFVFVAGSSDLLPWQAWTQQVGALLAETVGLAGAYLMDPHATVAFADRVGHSHAVPAGGVRTFLPEADPAVRVDGRRHRILGPARIAADPDWKLRRMLGWASREQLLGQQLPPRFSRVDRSLQRIETETLVDQLSPGQQEIFLSDGPPAETSAREVSTGPADMLTIGPDVVAEPRPFAGLDVAVVDALQELTRELLGSTDLGIESIAAIARLAEHGHATRESVGELRARLLSDLEQIANLEDTQARLQSELEDVQLSWAEELEATSQLQDQVRHLQRELMQAGLGNDAWSEVPLEDRTNPPENFTELFERQDELKYLVLTADQRVAEELNDHDLLGNSASKAWTALLALNDYARARESKAFNQGFHAYLKDAPAGYRSYSAHGHSPVESPTVKNNGKFHDCRVFPVPTSIDPSGSRYMDAHLKLGAKKSISPRIHYLDAVALDGKIYVGYIGRHLPSPKTN